MTSPHLCTFATGRNVRCIGWHTIIVEGGVPRKINPFQAPRTCPTDLQNATYVGANR